MKHEQHIAVLVEQRSEFKICDTAFFGATYKNTSLLFTEKFSVQRFRAFLLSVYAAAWCLALF